MMGTVDRFRTPLLALCLVLTAVALVTSYSDAGTDDADLWWHLKYGEQVVERATWTQAHDEWSWTPHDDDWKYVTWLSDALMYVSFRAAGGPAGPLALQALLYLGVIGTALSLAWTRRRSIDPLDLVLVVLAFLSMKLIAGLPKAENFTVFFFAITAAIYAHARITGRDRFWLLPIVFWLWMNSHGGVLAGYLLLGTLATGETIARRLDRGLDRRAYLHLLVFGGTAIGVAGINPHGLHWMVDAVGSMASLRSEFTTVGLSAMQSRWGDLIGGSIYDGYATATAWILVGMFFTILGFTVRAHRRGEGIDPTLLIGTTGFFVAGMQMQRASLFLPLFFLMTSVLWMPRGEDDAHGRRPLAAGVGLVALTILCIGLHFTSGSPLHWGGSSYHRAYPMAASAFVRDQDLPGPLFNDYGTGGYLVWDLAPERKVYVDPRYQPYDPPFMQDYLQLVATQTAEAFDARADRFGFRTAVIDHRNLPQLCSALVKSERWTLVFLGPAAAVYVQSDVVPPQVAAAIGENTDPLRFADPTDPISLAAATNLVIDRRPDVVVDVAHLLRHQTPGYVLRGDPVADNFERYLTRRAWFDVSGTQLTADQVKSLFHQTFDAGDLVAARFIAAAYVLVIPDDEAMWFDRACVESRAGNLALAAHSLEQALVRGFADTERIATTDDLDPLRRSRHYVELMARNGFDPRSARSAR